MESLIGEPQAEFNIAVADADQLLRDGGTKEESPSHRRHDCTFCRLFGIVKAGTADETSQLVPGNP